MKRTKDDQQHNNIIISSRKIHKQHNSLLHQSKSSQLPQACNYEASQLDLFYFISSFIFRSFFIGFKLISLSKGTAAWSSLANSHWIALLTCSMIRISRSSLIDFCLSGRVPSCLASLLEFSSSKMGAKVADEDQLVIVHAKLFFYLEEEHQGNQPRN